MDKQRIEKIAVNREKSIEDMLLILKNPLEPMVLL